MLYRRQMSDISFYTERVVNVWNHLPSDFVEFSTLSAFERTINWWILQTI